MRYVHVHYCTFTCVNVGYNCIHCTYVCMYACGIHTIHLVLLNYALYVHRYCVQLHVCIFVGDLMFIHTYRYTSTYVSWVHTMHGTHGVHIRSMWSKPRISLHTDWVVYD